jgi:hypothetical protein
MIHQQNKSKPINRSNSTTFSSLFAFSTLSFFSPLAANHLPTQKYRRHPHQIIFPINLNSIGVPRMSFDFPKDQHPDKASIYGDSEEAKSAISMKNYVTLSA